MKPDWRELLASDEFYHTFMLAESRGQFLRMVATAGLVLWLLSAAREDSAVAHGVASYADSLLSEPITLGVLSRLEVPLSCCAYVLSSLGMPALRPVVRQIASREDPELGWAPQVALLCLRMSTSTSARWVPEVATQAALSLASRADTSPVGLSGAEDTVDYAATDASAMLAA